MLKVKKNLKENSKEKKNSNFRNHVFFYLNGEKKVVEGADAFLPLSEWIRRNQLLTGTKIVCSEGDCGACSLLKCSPDQPEWTAFNSCIKTTFQMDGFHFVTVEGLRKTKNNSNPETLTTVQKCMLSQSASQCGFCTPGFVMTITGLVEKKCSALSKKSSNKNHSIQISEKDAKNALTGNLCRCTGYAPILKATEKLSQIPSMELLNSLYPEKEIFKDLRRSTAKSVFIENEERSLFIPKNTLEALNRIEKLKDSKLQFHLLSGGTDLGVLQNKNKCDIQHFISLQSLKKEKQILKKKSILSCGSLASLHEVRREVQKPFPEFSKFLDLFASPQIKNEATFGGNLGTASPIGDTLPFLLMSEATIHLHSFKKGKTIKRIIPATKYWTGYRQTQKKADEIITQIDLPLLKNPATTLTRLYKTSQRKDMDISAVSAAFKASWTPLKKSEAKLSHLSLALGGVAATPIRICEVEKTILSQPISSFHEPSFLQTLENCVQKEVKPLSDFRGSETFRRLLVLQFLKSFLFEVQQSALKTPLKKASL